MALRLNQVLELDVMKGMTQVAGFTGNMEAMVYSAEIADFEFAEEVAAGREEEGEANLFEPNSFVFSTLLFAHHNPESILPAVKELYRYGAVGFAYKTAIYTVLPQEVLDFADQVGFPIFSFGSNIYFENIIYEIMDSARKDDDRMLDAPEIKRMIDGTMERSQVVKIGRALSLVFQKNIMVAFVMPRDDSKVLDYPRAQRNVYMNKNLSEKSMLRQYGRGFFIILTSQRDDEKSFQVILSQIVGASGLREEEIDVFRSNVNQSFEGLDVCFRESYQVYMASKVEQQRFSNVEEIGSYQYLIPLCNTPELNRYSDAIIKILREHEEYLDTAIAFVQCKGNINATASTCLCHYNSIKYRLDRINQILWNGSKTTPEIYSELATAVRIYLLQNRDFR